MWDIGKENGLSPLKEIAEEEKKTVTSSLNGER
jgi:hypothetical protein